MDQDDRIDTILKIFLALRAVAMDGREPDACFATGIAYLWKKELEKAFEEAAPEPPEVRAN